MKKNIKITTTLIFAALVALLFTSCFDPIYSVVRTDVQPEKPTVSGPINSIARFNTKNKEYLVLAANGGLRYKEADNQSHGSWKTYSNLPFSTPHSEKWTGNQDGEYIAKVVADATYLYIITADFNNYSFKIYSSAMPNGWETKKENWKEIKKLDGYKNSNVFFSNDPNPSNRKAYLRLGEIVKKAEDNKDDKIEFKYTYFELLGDKLKEITPVAENDKTQIVNSVVVINGTPKFFSGNAVITNGKMIYFANGEDLMYVPVTGGDAKKALSAGAPIASLALTSDSILIGCGGDTKAGGLKRTSLDSKTGIPSSSLEDFNNNATFQIISSYQVLCLLNATPNETEVNSKLYATAMFPGVPAGTSKNSDKGLWSYYPNRGNWNRE